MESLAIIFVSALASSACALGVVLWITSTRDTRTNRLALELSVVHKTLRAHAQRIESLASDVKQSASTHLKAELADLVAAVDMDRARTRKELGKLWAKSAGGREPVVIEGEIDTDHQALIDLQRANGAQ